MKGLPGEFDELLSKIVNGMKKLDDEQRRHVFNVLGTFCCKLCGTWIEGDHCYCASSYDE